MNVKFAWYVFFACLYLQKLNAQKVDLVLPLGHQREVNKAIFSPDRKLIYTASADYSVSVWDAISGHEIRKFKGHNGAVNNLAISANGKYLVTVSEEGKAFLWNASNGKMLKMMPHHSMPVSQVCISPMTNFLVTAAYSVYYQKSVLTFWGLPNGEEAKTFDFPDEIILCIGISTEKKSVMLFTDQGNLYRIDGNTFDKNVIAYGIKSQLACFDEKLNLVASEQRNQFTLFSTDHNKPQATIATPTQKKNCAVNFSANGDALLVGSSDGVAYLYQINTGKLLQTFEGHSARVNSLILSPDQKLLLTASSDKTACLFDATNGKLQTRFEGKSIAVNDFSLLPTNNNMLTLFGDSTLKQWKIADRISLEKFLSLGIDQEYLSISHDMDKMATSGKKQGNIISGNNKTIHKKLEATEQIKHIVVSPDGSRIAYLDNSGQLKISNDATFAFSNFGSAMKTSIYSDFNITAQNELLVSVGGKLNIYNLATGKIRRFFSVNPDTILAFGFSENLKYYALATTQSKIKVFEDGTDTAVFEVPGNYENKTNEMQKISFSKDGKYFAFTGDDRLINLVETAKKEITHSYFGHTDRITNLQFTDDGNFLMSSSTDHTIKMWQVQFVPEEAKVISKVTSADYSYQTIMLSKYDPNAYLWNNPPTQMEVASFIALKNEDWIIITPDRYYFCNKGAARELGYNKNGKYYSFEQFDLKFNRPDIVLKRIGINDSNLINAYKKAYEKRLRKMGFTEDQLNDDLNLPELKIKNFEYLPTVTDSEEVNFNLDLRDEKYTLNRLNCWINGVSVFGKHGMNLANVDSKTIQQPVKISLTPGINTIRFSVLNSKGVESYKSTSTIEYRPKKKPLTTLHIIAISVSEYQDAAMNLRYAVKDGRDMVKALSPQKSFDKIQIDTFFNQNVTSKIIATLKSKLGRTGINDEVILFISGHGTLDTSLDFFFATHNMDFNNPQKFGISYDALEDLLDSIPARKKLMLMDACHSGELDKEEKLVAKKITSQASMPGNVTAYEARSSQLLESDSKVGLENSYEMMQELFAGINKGSGAVVISAAAGKGYAFESPRWNNGVFSYSIMNGIVSHEADKNNDKKITARELLDFVSITVEKLTNGAQKPTSRKENFEYDWVVWEY